LYRGCDAMAAQCRSNRQIRDCSRCKRFLS
jgi:hypothetical protein